MAILIYPRRAMTEIKGQSLCSYVRKMSPRLDKIILAETNC